MYDVSYSPRSIQQLRGIHAFDRRRITDAVHQRLASRDPTRASDVKPIYEIGIAWISQVPFYQLRIGPYRVFFETDPHAKAVVVQAVLFKGSRATREILDEVHSDE